jgi:Antitoxin-like ribbon-helix-helix
MRKQVFPGQGFRFLSYYYIFIIYCYLFQEKTNYPACKQEDFRIYLCVMEKKQTSFRLSPEVLKKLKFIAVEHDKTLKDLYLEAVEDLIRKYGKKPKK